MLETTTRIAGSFAGGSAADAAPAWARLAAAEQDALSAALTRLLIRFRAVEPLYVSRSDRQSYDIAFRRLEGACQGDYQFRAMADLGLALADLRRARRETPDGGGPDHIRLQNTFLSTPALDAFDAILATPTSSVADGIHL
ncbi:hypothetical protein [Streptomyces hainanensis]|uniref:hypothetical protein n=1 Tax=Streptomyces hainanensis TaxID=402648 RepID=UPI001A9D3FF8|nr:hypothetical protein [Streptomyces hainanensis]